MPTPQVTNPATLFATAAPAGRKTDTSNPAQSFGQLLSREVAGRQPSQPANAPARKEASSAPDNAAQSASASSSAVSAQQAGARANAGEAKQAAKSSKEKTSDKDDASETREATARSPEDLLAMVANLVQMTSPAAEAAGTEALPQDAQAMVDPALLLAAAGMLRGDHPAIRNDNAGIASDTQSAGKTLGLDTDGRRAGSKDLLLDQTRAAQADASIESTAADDLAVLAAKGQELLMGAESESASTSFAAALQDTLTQGPADAQAFPQMMQMQAAARALETKAADRLTPAVGSAAWDQALGQKVVWMVAGEQQSASLTLNPPDLGPLQVVLNVSNSQATATFTAAQPEVRQALEAALPKLREMLGEAGIQLGQATVNSGSPNQQSQQGQSSASRHGNHGNGGGDGAGTAAVQASRAPASSGGIGIVDTFV